MGDFLKLWIDFGQMSKQLPIGILQHHYESFDPSEMKSLQEAISHFHMSDLEASDYRSAYHQFSDWLYGWNVSDETEQNGVKLRNARDINIEFDRERIDAQRLMKTFETLTSLSLRHLKICYSDIEAEIPRLGQGLDTFTNIHKVDDDAKDDVELNADGNKALENVWGNKFAEEATTAAAVGLDDFLDAQNSGIQASRDQLGAFNEERDADNSSRIPSVLGSQTGLFELTDSQMKLNGSESNKGSFQFLVNDNDNEELGKTGTSTPEEQIPATGQGLMAGTIDEPHLALQRDVNHVFREVDQSTEYTLLTMCSIAGMLAFSELLQDREVFAKANMIAHDLSRDFISNTLKTVWDLLNKEMPGETTLAGIRNPNDLKNLIHNLINLRAVNGVPPKLRMRKLHHKFATLHVMFTLVDIHIFPNFVLAHKGGMKCAQFSQFDSNLWLTGGYDCIIRITDIRPSNKHMCLAQYVGHKSIVTDVHFCHEDGNIVSSSFDRTVKIWNARTALPDRTLSGHTDGVTTCDVSPDGRYIASGSLDTTVRFWDFSNGECITIIKKHTRWLKVVRFSPDSRYLATAGMDRRIYLWDTKILTNSRSPTHSRLWENFGDYVLDMVLFKPNFLLACARDSTIRLFDYINGHELQSVSLSPSWACTIALSKNEEYFATGSFDNNINIFRVKDFSKVREIRAFNLGILCVRFPSDLGYVIAGTTEGFMQQIDL